MYIIGDPRSEAGMTSWDRRARMKKLILILLTVLMGVSMAAEKKIQIGRAHV